MNQQSKSNAEVTSGYVVAAAWVHCFVGSQESVVRWVLDLQSRTLVAAQIQRSLGWRTLSGPDAADVLESLVDNNVAVEYEDFGLTIADEVPEWASNALA